MQDNISTKSHWTESAIECYERGYDCFGCPTQKLLESGKCQMKDSVLNLIQTKGLPPKDDDLFPQFKNQALKIMKLINGGVETVEKLASELGTTRASIVNCFNAEIFPYYENQGFLTQKKDAFSAFIEFFKDFIHAKRTNKDEIIMFDEDLKIKYADFLKPLVEAVKKGFESYDDLVQETGMTSHKISVYWANLLTPWIKDGLLIRNSGKTQKQEVIDFIRSRLIDVQNGNAAEAKEQASRVKEPLTKLKGKIQPLTEMEQTVLNLLLHGLNYQQIAEKIPIAITTVKTHVNNIFTKRGYHSLRELLVTELNKSKSNLPEENKNNRIEEELNQTKLLLEGKNAQYNAAVDNAKRLQQENESLKNDIEEIKKSSKFTLYEPIEELRMQYSKQIDEWKQLITATKIKLEALKELEQFGKDKEMTNAR